MYALAHLNLSTASFKCLSERIYVSRLQFIKSLIFAVLEHRLIQKYIDCVQFFYIIFAVFMISLKVSLRKYSG